MLGRHGTPQVAPPYENAGLIVGIEESTACPGTPAGPSIWDPSSWTGYIYIPETELEPDTIYWITLIFETPLAGQLCMICVTDADYQDDNYWFWAAAENISSLNPRGSAFGKSQYFSYIAGEWKWQSFSDYPQPEFRSNTLCWVNYTRPSPPPFVPAGWLGLRMCGNGSANQPVPSHCYMATGWNGDPGSCSWFDVGGYIECGGGAACSSPPGEHGATVECGAGYGGQPSTIHKYQCNDGTWVDKGENCPYCPDCGGADCKNPPGIHGKIDDCGVGYGGQPDTTHKYQCNDGTWVEKGEKTD